MAAYGFLLEPGEYTWEQFADAIAAYYNLDDPRNKAVHGVVLRCHGALAQQEVVVEDVPPPASRKTRHKPNKRFPFVFIGLWRNGEPEWITRCRNEAEAKEAARNFFNLHTAGSVKGGKIKLLDGSRHIFDAGGNYLFTVPPLD